MPKLPFITVGPNGLTVELKDAITLEGRCLWYDRRDGRGVLIDSQGNEYYTDSSVLLQANYLDAKDEVRFKVRELGGTTCAYDVELVDPCNGLGGCGQSDCQRCCPHDERDHDICLDCGHEEDPGRAIDRAMDYWEDR